MYVPGTAVTGAVDLAEAVVADIRRGRLAPGECLPGTRQLGGWVGLHRNTVVRAYADLRAQGWVETRPGGGTFVLAAPVGPSRAESTVGTAGFTLPTARVAGREPREARFRLVAGQPDLRLLPLDALGRALRRVLRGRGRRLVDYGDPAGLPRFRRSLAAWLEATRGLPGGPEDVVVTRGAQQALFLAAQVLFRPGDRVGVEALGYGPAWDALRLAGAVPVPLPIDEDGLVVDEVAARPDLKGVYVTPHHQYPTGALLSATRREQLLALARDRRFPILEDDYDHELHWEGRPLVPLAGRDRHGVVVYIGTLSKAFAPGLRIGWLRGPRPFLARVADVRRAVDRQGDAPLEAALAELLDDGEIGRHVRRMRRVYEERRTVVLDGLAAHLGDLAVGR
ncbi:MAG: PLP-dependent aminotransferase family protein, partial [Myxococcales bacterium]|nr:PLP-dependent aminotransferase family protein [Myxococcales bacterium]